MRTYVSKPLLFVVITKTLIFVHGPLRADEQEPAGSGDDAKSIVAQAENPLEKDRIHLLGNVGFAPAIMDMQSYNAGGLSLEAEGHYFLVKNIYLGPKAGYERLLIFTDADLAAHLIDLQAVIGAYVIGGFHPHLALGTTIAGNRGYGYSRHEALFSASLGLSYTFWLERVPSLGIEVCAELNAMFDSRFERTDAKSGVAVDNMFLYLALSAGLRYAF